MTNAQLTAIHKLPTDEKIRLVQDLWDEIAQEIPIDSISEEHKAILEERMTQINSGNADFKSWSDIQAKYKH